MPVWPSILCTEKLKVLMLLVANQNFIKCFDHNIFLLNLQPLPPYTLSYNVFMIFCEKLKLCLIS